MGLAEKLKNFIAPEDDEEEGEEVEFDSQDDVKAVSEYEPRQSKGPKLPNDTKIVMFEPRSFDEAEDIARYLKDRKAAVVNLHRLQRDYAQRTIDFLTGVVFALDGTIQKIAHNAILCTPRSIGVHGDISLDQDDDQ